MKFEIDFNRMDNDKLLERLGAKKELLEHRDTYFINLDNFEQLEKLLNKLEKIEGDVYSAILSFDDPMIFLDNYI